MAATGTAHSLYALLVHRLQAGVKIDEFRPDWAGHQMALLELRALAFDVLVLEAVPGPCFSIRSRKLWEVVRVDVDRRALADSCGSFSPIIIRSPNRRASRRTEKMEERVSFVSDKLRLRRSPLPEPRAARHAAFLVLHGFGSNKDGVAASRRALLTAWLRRAALRFPRCARARATAGASSARSR